MDYQEIKKRIAEIEFKEGNTRSLAMSLSSFIDLPDAWQFARSIIAKYGANFEREDIIQYLNLVDVSHQDSSSSSSINSKIRQFLSEGKTVSEIAKLLSISYQRTKNVQKIQLKKSQTN